MYRSDLERQIETDMCDVGHVLAGVLRMYRSNLERQIETDMCGVGCMSQMAHAQHRRLYQGCRPNVAHRNMDTLDYAFKTYICFFVLVIVYFCRWANRDVVSESPPGARKARDVSPWRCR